MVGGSSNPCRLLNSYAWIWATQHAAPFRSFRGFGWHIDAFDGSKGGSHCIHHGRGHYLALFHSRKMYSIFLKTLPFRFSTGCAHEVREEISTGEYAVTWSSFVIILVQLRIQDLTAANRITPFPR